MNREKHEIHEKLAAKNARNTKKVEGNFFALHVFFVLKKTCVFRAFRVIRGLQKA